MTTNGAEESKSMSEAASLPMGIGLWMTCSVGMLVFNKLAITAFPLECTLVALQMAAGVVAMGVFCYSSIHIGSMRDVARWMLVVPFFTGMLLSSILALKHAPMSLVVTFRAISPLVSLMIERMYPNPLQVSSAMLGAIGSMILGVGLYSVALDNSDYSGIMWVFMNNFFAIGDRLLQRLMLSADQKPVDISKTGITLLNNLLGMIPLAVVALILGENSELSKSVAALNGSGYAYILASCIVGVGISYMGVWVQSRISATSFLVLVNSNKFCIIFLEAYVMGTKSLAPIQVLGASIAVLAGCAYGKAREAVEAEAKAAQAEKSENTALLEKSKP